MYVQLEPPRLSLHCGATLSALHFIRLLPAPAACLVPAALSVAINRGGPVLSRDHQGFLSLTSISVPFSVPFRDISFYRDRVLSFPTDASTPIYDRLSEHRSQSICGLWNHSLCIPVAAQSVPPVIMSVILCTGMACLIPVYLADAVMPRSLAPVSPCVE